MSLPTTGTGRSVWSVQFYEENDGIDFGSGANIDDLPAGDCTIEFWAKVPLHAHSVDDRVDILAKGSPTVGWTAYVANSFPNLFVFRLNHVTDAAPQWTVVNDSRWHHFALDWEFAVLTARLFVDGILKDTEIAVGAYVADAAEDCLINANSAIGTNDGSFQIGPIRLSDSRRYTGASFDPPRRINWPANDANAQLITRMNDGAGATVTDYSGNGNDGTITFGANTRWYNDPV